jgi:hypothetical protein
MPMKNEVDVSYLGEFDVFLDSELNSRDEQCLGALQKFDLTSLKSCV